MDKLKCKMKSYKCDQDRLYLCQVAVEFERALCSHVIPQVFSKDKGTSSANLNGLLNMLNSGDQGLIPLNSRKNDIKTILRRAHQRWKKVCDDLQLYLQSRKQSLERKSTSLTHQSRRFLELLLY